MLRVVNGNVSAIDSRNAWIAYSGQIHPELAKKLMDLGNSPTPEQMDFLFKTTLVQIGDKSVFLHIHVQDEWECQGCEKLFKELVEVKKGYNTPCYICKSCIEKMSTFDLQ